MFPVSKVCLLAIIGGEQRWQNLSTSMGGLQRTWDRIKSWVNTQLAGKANTSHTHTYSQITNLSTWKTTNFGSGTYSNSGSLTINTTGSIIVGDSRDALKLTMRKGTIDTYNFNIDFNGNDVINGTVDTDVPGGGTTSGAGLALFNFTLGSSHTISFGTDVNYIIIDKSKIASGNGRRYTYSGSSVVLVMWAK